MHGFPEIAILREEVNGQNVAMEGLIQEDDRAEDGKKDRASQGIWNTGAGEHSKGILELRPPNREVRRRRFRHRSLLNRRPTGDLGRIPLILIHTALEGRSMRVRTGKFLPTTLRADTGSFGSGHKGRREGSDQKQAREQEKNGIIENPTAHIVTKKSGRCPDQGGMVANVFSISSRFWGGKESVTSFRRASLRSLISLMRLRTFRFSETGIV